MMYDEPKAISRLFITLYYIQMRWMRCIVSSKMQGPRIEGSYS